VNRKRGLLGSIFLRALGYESREEIIKSFYKTQVVKVGADRDKTELLIGRVLSKPVHTDVDGEQKKIYRAEKNFIHTMSMNWFFIMSLKLKLLISPQKGRSTRQ
jgi:DNA-directed RNA polymerase subunit beta